MTQPDVTPEPDPADTPDPATDPEATPVETQGVPTEPVEGASTEQVIGLQGKPVQHPRGVWLAAVDESGDLVEQDGLLVQVRPTTDL